VAVYLKKKKTYLIMFYYLTLIARPDTFFVVHKAFLSELVRQGSL